MVYKFSTPTSIKETHSADCTLYFNYWLNSVMNKVKVDVDQ